MVLNRIGNIGQKNANRFRFLAILILLAPTLAAQIALDDQTRRTALAYFQGPPQKSSNCRFSPAVVRLTFSQQQALGNQIILDTSLATEDPLPLVGLWRIRPKNDPTWQYFGTRFDLPPKSTIPRNSEFTVSSRFILGPGKYEMESLLGGTRGEICRARQSVSASPVPRTDPNDAVVAPNQILSLVDAFSVAAELPARREGELLVVLNLGRVRRYRSGIDGYELSTLGAMLQGVLNRFRFAKTRVVAASFDQQTVIFDQTPFLPDDFGDLSDALSRLDLGTVSIDKLARPLGHQELLDKLFDFPKPPQAVVFLGFTSRFDDRPLESIVEKLQPLAGRVFYFQRRLNRFTPYGIVADVNRDLLNSLVDKSGGRSFDITDPNAYAKALVRAEATLDPTPLN